MTPVGLLLILLVVMLLATAYFSYTSSRDVETVSAYLYARDSDNPGISVSQSWMNSVASNFQTASVLIVGIELGYQFGLTMIWTAITFCGGIILLRSLLARLSLPQLETLYKTQRTPYHRLFPNLAPRLRKPLHFAIYFAVLGTAILELWLTTGVAKDVVESFISRSTAESIPAEQVANLLGLSLTFLLLIYIFFGGYRAVIQNDPLQLSLIVALLIVLVIGTVFSVFNVEVFSWGRFISGTNGNQFHTFDFWALIVGILSLNLFWQLIDPQVWQRGQAARASKEFIESQKANATFTFLTWAIPVFIGSSLAGSGAGKTSFAVSTAFDSLISLDMTLGFDYWLAAVLLAIAISGIFAAALSSADTAIIAFVADLLTFSRRALTLAEARSKGVTVTMFAAVAASVLYWRSPDIKLVIFAIYSGMPLFVFALYRFISTGGNETISKPFVSNLLVVLFLAMCGLAIVINMVPAVYQAVGTWAYFIPLIAMVLGVFFRGKGAI